MLLQLVWSWGKGRRKGKVRYIGKDNSGFVEGCVCRGKETERGLARYGPWVKYGPHHLFSMSPWLKIRFQNILRGWKEVKRTIFLTHENSRKFKYFCAFN